MKPRHCTACGMEHVSRSDYCDLCALVHERITCNIDFAIHAHEPCGNRASILAEWRISDPGDFAQGGYRLQICGDCAEWLRAKDRKRLRVLWRVGTGKPGRKQRTQRDLGQSKNPR